MISGESYTPLYLRCNQTKSKHFCVITRELPSFDIHAQFCIAYFHDSEHIDHFRAIQKKLKKPGNYYRFFSREGFSNYQSK